MTDEVENPVMFDFDYPHDLQGHIIWQGCRVAYAVTTGRSATLRIGTIVDMKRTTTGYYGWFTKGEGGKPVYNKGERQYWDMLLVYDEKYAGEYGRYGNAKQVWVHFPQRCVVLE